MSGVYIKDLSEADVIGLKAVFRDKVVVVPEHGRWKGEHKCGSFSHPDSITYECTECGYSVYTIYGFPHLPNYCPKCGARMGGEA